MTCPALLFGINKCRLRPRTQHTVHIYSGRLYHLGQGTKDDPGEPNHIGIDSNTFNGRLAGSHLVRFCRQGSWHTACARCRQGISPSFRSRLLLRKYHLSGIYITYHATFTDWSRQMLAAIHSVWSDGLTRDENTKNHYTRLSATTLP